MGQVWVSTTPHGYVQHSRHLPRKDVWTLRWSRHSTFLHWCNFACYKRILKRTSYCPQRDVHPPPEVWDQGQRQQIMLWRPQIWLFGLSRHLWRGYAHTKESQTCKQLRQFISMINFYRDMWQKRSEILDPLTALTSKNFNYDWKDEHQKCVDAIKRVIGREVLANNCVSLSLWSTYIVICGNSALSFSSH